MSGEGDTPSYQKKFQNATLRFVVQTSVQKLRQLSVQHRFKITTILLSEISLYDMAWHNEFVYDAGALREMRLSLSTFISSVSHSSSLRYGFIGGAGISNQDPVSVTAANLIGKEFQY